VEAGLSGIPLAQPSLLKPGTKLAAMQPAPMQLEVKYARTTLGVDPKGNERIAFVRTYNGQLVGPTMRAKPGDTLLLELVNNLPEDPADPSSAISRHGGHEDKNLADGHSVNTPHGFNVTNLHTHGLHVRPDAPSRCPNPATCDARSDDVLVSILPGQKQRYEIEIPKNHPPGTHWYHAHKHGAVAMQLATGMAGAIIIEGGLDELPELQKATEQLLVFQQLMMSPCGRRDLLKGPSPDPSGAPKECTIEGKDQKLKEAYESCGAYFQALNQRLKEAGRPELPFPSGAQCVENFELLFGPGKWTSIIEPRFGNRTSINGQFGPTLNARQGEVQRWRMVHAGIRETLQLGLVRKEDLASQQLPNALKDPNAIQKRIRVPIVAYDGITTGRMDDVDNVELQPGYRVDVLVRIDEPGDYYLVDLQTVGFDALRAKPEEFELLAKVHVAPSSEAPMPLPSKEALGKLAPYKHVEDTEITGCQYNIFDIVPGDDATKRPTFFGVNGKAYNPSNPPRALALGTADEWVLDSTLANHPFHIHVNPFEVVDGYDSIPAGTWKDTLLVNKGKPVRVRTRYEDFTGKFVLHCHILDHEDQGMMQEVEVVKQGTQSSACPTQKGSASLCMMPPPENGVCPSPSASLPTQEK
jgi:FtsP/CotA-like multicopper oxidase with cupredoxin domain